MMNKKTIFIGFLIFTLTAIFNFAVVSANGNQGADIKGKVKSITRDKKSSETLATIYIERVSESDSQIDKAYVLVTKKTQIYIQESDTQQEAAFTDIKKGDMIEAYFTDDPRIMIYPTRAAAKEIVILRGGQPKRKCD